jgi:hypothetical protein
MTIAGPVIALTLLLPASAQAPTHDPSASSLAVNRGEQVSVSRVGATGTLHGRVLRLADDGLVLRDGHTSHTIPYAEVERIVRARDSVWNGAWIGYGVGFGVGAAMVLADPCDPQHGGCFNDPGLAALTGLLITGPLGMVAGAITDALMKKPGVVYDRHPGLHATVTVAPTIVRRGAGFRGAIAF